MTKAGGTGFLGLSPLRWEILNCHSKGDCHGRLTHAQTVGGNFNGEFVASLAFEPIGKDIQSTSSAIVEITSDQARNSRNNYL